MTDEVNLDELKDLLALGSTMPEPSVHPALATVSDAAPTVAAGGETVEERKRRKKKKEKKRSKQERREKTDRKSKRRRTERSDGDDGEEDAFLEGDLSDDHDEDDDRVQSKYVIDAAESSDSDADDIIADDEEEDSPEEGFDDADGGPRFEKRKAFIFQEGDDQHSADELGRQYEERVRALRRQGGALAEAGGGGGMPGGAASAAGFSAQRYTSRMMPGPKDPKVFAVRVHPRKQRVLVARLVNKCYRQRTGQYHEGIKVDLGIISVFAIDRVREYIYIEAWRREFVQRALSGLVGVMLYSISAVDPTEVLQTLERKATHERIPIGAFVRMRQRFYRNDLAQVAAVHADGVHVTVKVVPREDFIDKPFNKATARLPPRFFAPSRAIDAHDNGDHFRWGDLRFDKDGYLLKTVSARMLIHGTAGATAMEKATTQELARFYNHNRERVREALQRAGEEEISAHIGDTVRVASGQLRDTVGTLTNIFSNDGTAMLSCVVPGRAEPVNLRVELSACVKHFAPGTHVIVEKGDHAGESGTVLQCCGDALALFLDRREASSSEIRVRAADCRQSKLVGTVGHSHGAWRLFDLCTVVDANAVACVTGLSADRLTVRTEGNEMRTLTYAEVRAVPRGQRQTSDPLQNIISRACEVMVLATPLTPIGLAGQSGRVEQVFNRTLFVVFRAVAANGGLVAVDAACVRLLGGRTTTRQAPPPKALPAPQRNAHNATRAEISTRVDSMDWQNNSEWYEPPSVARQ